ncbi:Glycosyl hydrolases family 16 [Teratosphaeria destructans]|uniref:Glycosyl hydrolases family 16 n=1 Tax=Teratosphaeria destructans TaxID=418781 RepID=A0A9W7W328_9PEZI|nr:Glycosyl hydrolases family 16 [Teratosphaeria destructans]
MSTTSAMAALKAMILSSVLALATATATTPISQCACGFQDPDSLAVYTESLIVYFNETDAIDSDIWDNERFSHKNEKGWNSIYKVGADPSNVRFVNDTLSKPPVQALELLTQPSDVDHLVKGAELRTIRKDIQYGSFQAALKPPTRWTGGTALSFLLKYNASQSLEMDLMNMNDPSDATVATLVNGEWPASDLETNFTILEQAGVDPWTQFVPVRMDWNKTSVQFHIAGNQTRAVTKHDRTIPVAGQPLSLKTWSTGDRTYMEGPPSGNASRSHVLYVRAFFNSSTMSDADHETWNQKCASGSFCLTNDMTLRGSSAFSAASEVRWTAPKGHNAIKRNAGIVAACCSAFGVFSLINVFLRRTPWARLKPGVKRRSSKEKSLRSFLRGSLYRLPEESQSVRSSEASEKGDTRGSSQYSTPGTQTPLPAYGTQTPRSGNATPAPPYETPPPIPDHNGLFRSVSIASLPRIPANIAHTTKDTNNSSVALGNTEESGCQPHEDAITPVDNHSAEVNAPRTALTQRSALTDPFDEKKVGVAVMTAHDQTPAAVTAAGKQPATTTIRELPRHQSTGYVPSVIPEPAVTPMEPTTEAPILHAPQPNGAVKPAPTKRIDYLAGLVAVACLGVTLHHWCQTFWPWVVTGYGNTAHYPKAEKWLEIFLGSYALTALWIGPFFLTATRFLSSNYLKNGKLEDIAKKELRRAPRLFVPIIIVSLLEYFLISMNLTAALESLPSVSWSTWPYVTAQKNFGVYLNNIIQLAYLMPNAIPEIVSHYCIGVLWTVPVQLQFTYVVLGASVLIRDIKKPWKRFGFYTVVILTAWYAKSWAACHWAGLVLSDLEATYKWKVYLNKKPWVKYLVMTGAFICAAGTPLVGALNSDWSFDTVENGIHPDFGTGRPIMADGPEYPNYNEPTLTILLFSIGLQILVELSTVVQWLLSTKVILLLHPHIMTIYLTHGFVMWTWGAWVSLALNNAGVPYWANLLINLVATYAVIFLLASILTPLIEFPTQALMRNLDRWMKEEPRPKRRTTRRLASRLCSTGMARKLLPASLERFV